jgi:hypothetical protein
MAISTSQLVSFGWSGPEMAFGQRPTFFRLALLLPLVVPVVTVMLVTLLDDIITSRVIGGFTFYIAGSAVFYTFPYLLLAAYLYIKLPHWGLAQQRAALWLAPLVVSAVAAAVFATSSTHFSANRWWNDFRTGFRLGLVIGYAYAGIIALVEYLSAPTDAATARGAWVKRS